MRRSDQEASERVLGDSEQLQSKNVTNYYYNISRTKIDYKFPEYDDIIHDCENKIAPRKRHAKMNLLYKGPLKIVNIFGDHTYELMDVNTNRNIGKYTKRMLRPYKKFQE